MEPAPPGASDRGPLTFGAPTGFGQTPFAGPVWAEAGVEPDVREPLRIVFHGVAASAVHRVV